MRDHEAWRYFQLQLYDIAYQSTVHAIQNVHQAEKDVLHVAVQILMLSPTLCMTLW